MQMKMFEIRDDGKPIPAVAVRLDLGTDEDPVFLYPLVGNRVEFDPIKWGDFTLFTAHIHIIVNWDRLTSGDVIDVSFICLAEVKKDNGKEKEQK